MKHKRVPLPFLLLAWLCVVGFHASIASADVRCTPNDFGVPRNFTCLPQKFLSADFDGDHEADLASGTYHGQTYRVEIQFSTGKSAASISFPASYPAFNIFARDIDDDNDQDLVIVSTAFSTSSAVWLNDDEGHFEHGSRWSWASLLTKDASRGVDSENSRNDSIALSNDHRASQSSEVAQGAPLQLHAIIRQQSLARFTKAPPNSFCSRGPPLDFAH
jgi:hypothetical protein